MDAIIECRENAISIDLVGGLARILRREKIRGCWKICMFMSLLPVNPALEGCFHISFTIYYLALFIFHQSVKRQTFLTSCLSSRQCYVSYSNFLLLSMFDHRETLRVDYLPLLLNRLTSPLQTLPKV